MNYIEYDEPVFRPPSEADSLIIQATIGCSHNGCTFCEMYKTKKFRARNISEIESDLKISAEDWPNPKKIFLADGDAFVLSTNKLKNICEAIYKYFPHRPRISAYATPGNILQKTPEELKEARKAGISLLYYGVESGNNAVLKKVCKGATPEEIARGILMAQEAGFDISVTWILGLGGKKLSREHALDTAKLLSKTGARYISALTLMPESELSAVESLRELRIFVENYSGPKTTFRSNHASNYLAIKGELPDEKDKILKLVDNAISNPEHFIRPEWARGL